MNIYLHDELRVVAEHTIKDKTTWKVRCKRNNDSQPWSTLQYYESRAGALLHAQRVSGEYFMIEVCDLNGNVVWTN